MFTECNVGHCVTIFIKIFYIFQNITMYYGKCLICVCTEC
jgi:hypothetical protein